MEKVQAISPKTRHHHGRALGKSDFSFRLR